MEEKQKMQERIKFFEEIEENFDLNRAKFYLLVYIIFAFWYIIENNYLKILVISSFFTLAIGSYILKTFLLFNLPQKKLEFENEYLNEKPVLKKVSENEYFINNVMPNGYLLLQFMPSITIFFNMIYYKDVSMTRKMYEGNTSTIMLFFSFELIILYYLLFKKIKMHPKYNITRAIYYSSFCIAFFLMIKNGLF